MCSCRGMRKSTLAFAVLIGLGAGFLWTGLDAVRGDSERAAALEAGARLTRELGLTDLCLFTEARYTRHLSQADWHAPFQDHPMALEHFPSGALVGVPATLRGPH